MANNYFDLYKRRLELEGKNFGDSMVKNTKNVMESAIQEHPFHKIVEIDGDDYDSALIRTNEGNVKQLLLDPSIDEDSLIGKFVKFNDETWLIIDYFENEVFPSVEIKYCNHQLNWKDGEDEYNYPCVITNTLSNREDVKSSRYGYFLPDDSLIVLTQLNEDTNKIKYFQRFLFDEFRAWRVTAIDNVSQVDKNGGILQMVIKSVPIKEGEIDRDIDSSGYSVIIEGNDEIAVGWKGSYQAFVFADGDKTENGVDWIIEDENSSVEIEEENDNELVLLGKNAGNIVVTAKYEIEKEEEENEIIEDEKEISIVDEERLW